jgi:hypothetical protein
VTGSADAEDPAPDPEPPAEPDPPAADPDPPEPELLDELESNVTPPKPTSYVAAGEELPDAVIWAVTGPRATVAVRYLLAVCEVVDFGARNETTTAAIPATASNRPTRMRHRLMSS